MSSYVYIVVFLSITDDCLPIGLAIKLDVYGTSVTSTARCQLLFYKEAQRKRMEQKTDLELWL